MNYGIGEDSWESLGLQGDPTSPSQRRSDLGVLWKDWCWSWNSNTLATWCKQLTHLKRPWCWEKLKVGGKGDSRGWDGWMASLTQWTWVWVNSGSWWWTGRPGVLQSMGHKESDATEWLNWTAIYYNRKILFFGILTFRQFIKPPETDARALFIYFFIFFGSFLNCLCFS